MTELPIRNLTFHQIQYGSAAYHATVALRDAVLRKPLGLSFTTEQLQAERDDYHLACYHEDNLVGCLILVPAAGGLVKMRQVAIAPEVQQQGIGKALVRFSEEFARRHRFTQMTLHARETAVPFYENLGYRREGERFDEVTLAHWKMWKNLAE